MELQFQNTEIPDDVIDCMISMCRTFLRPTVDSKFQLENVDYIEVIYEKLIEMGCVGTEEIVLLKAWLHDLEK